MCEDLQIGNVELCVDLQATCNPLQDKGKLQMGTIETSMYEHSFNSIENSTGIPIPIMNNPNALPRYPSTHHKS